MHTKADPYVSVLFGSNPEFFLRAHGIGAKIFVCTRERIQVDPIRDKNIFDFEFNEAMN